MELKVISIDRIDIAELETDERVINSVDDALDLIGNSGYLGAQGIILKKQNLAEGFFKLETKLAGEILQKFSNYRMKLAIVGEFDKDKSKSLKDFIFESNKSGQIFFTESVAEARRLLSAK
ncbi:DUF4180 domain-containing protein [Desertivirga arenae]|uniref:DUF4180 domain-containing protein n=1 Tax=Desertivirga arenae TaxID=2810309 RepID=UPI001A964DB0|nr:DUF4180 domain-containing protein [Pedobacter sp. SYSU D00823]